MRASADEADHGCAATAIVGIHAETNHAGRGFVFETHRSLTARAAHNVEIHGAGGRACRGSDPLCGAGRLRLNLHRGRAHLLLSAPVEGSKEKKMSFVVASEVERNFDIQSSAIWGTVKRSKMVLENWGGGRGG